MPPSRRPPNPSEPTAAGAGAPVEGDGLRIGCLLVPGLPLAAARRAHPEWEGEPVAIVTGTGPRAEILAVSPEAAAWNVRPGQTAVHARAACAGLVLSPNSPALERAAREALRDAALSTSPRVEAAPPEAGAYRAEASLFVDARGMASLFHSEAGFASALAERAQRLGLPAVAAVAGSREVARIAARRAWGCEESPRVIPPGDDAAFLAPLPLDLLDPSDALADALGRFGLHRVGDLLRVPEKALTTRFGERIRPLLALARGNAHAPPPPVPENTRFEEATDLEFPALQIEPLLFVLRGLLERLAERLACRGHAWGDLVLELGLEDGGRDVRRVGMAAPHRDVRVALRLLDLALQSHPPRAAVERVIVHTTGTETRRDQLDFFRPAGPPPAALSRTLAELGALCGEGRVGTPAVADDHRPDAYAVRAFRTGPGKRAPLPIPWTEAAGTQAPGAGTTGADAAPAEARSLAVRALRPPVPAQVRAPHGTPETVFSALARGDVVRCAGPWRTTGHWWNEDERYAFDHFDVQTSDGWVIRLRHDWVARGWSIDGVYD